LPGTAAAPEPAFKGRRGTRPGRDGRAPQGSNKQRIMALVAERPGIKAREITEITGLKRSVVNATVSRLKRQGELNAVDGGLHVSPDAVRDDRRTDDPIDRADASAA
jgi:predicted transcriptional regulator of viral defense system